MRLQQTVKIRYSTGNVSRVQRREGSAIHLTRVAARIILRTQTTIEKTKDVHAPNGAIFKERAVDLNNAPQT